MINKYISQFIINIITRNFLRLRGQENPKSVVLVSKMSESNGSTTAEAVLLLTTRLAKAEKRLKLLTCEINDIKQELVSIQQASSTNTNIRQFSTSTRRTAIELDGPSSSSSNGEAKRPRFDNFTREDDHVVVYTDGACENNGRSNAKAGIGVWFGHAHPLNVSQPVNGRATNNTAEIQACVQAITIAHKNGIKKLKIKTDSQFVINSMTQWIHRWKKNNWKVASGGDVKNKEDFVILDNACKQLDHLVWEHVAGHKGIVGNEEADKLAVAGAMNYK